MEALQRRDSDISLAFFQEVLGQSDPDIQLTSLQVSEASGRGDNYTSMVYRVRATGTRNKQPWSKSFVYKCLPTSRIRREAFKSDALFLNEVSFYTRVLPAMLKFQSSRGCDDFNEVPKVFLAKEDVLVLEDMKQRQYVMADRKKFLNVEHCEAVVKALAKFHGLSLGMKSLEPELFQSEVVDSVTECLFKTENEEWYRDYYKSATENAVEFVKECLVTTEDRTKYLDKFENFLDESFFGRMVRLVQPEEPISVVCHGDCWTNNILFKYTETGQLSRLCFLDFQLIRYGSPALDLVNFLYVCTSSVLRSSHMNYLIGVYCDTLKGFLLKLGSSSDLFGGLDFTDIIHQEIHRCGKFGLGLAVDMIPISTCDSDQAPDLYADVAENSEREGESEKPVWTKSEVCRRRMTDLVQELIDKGDL
ncbi:hypothetical protein RUM44_001269 [Polyplax serrata]|uniref:CHK kinase-like domain-containing protein n=1 Tax=Polyplax serrata TaxID=468196 RepID=A0ABR1AJK3_POLSC